jgi:hypothetical protein
LQRFHLSIMARRQKTSQAQEFSTQDIPHENVKHALPPVSPPLKTTRLSHLIFVLLLLTALLGAYYSYRYAQYRSRIGGWWDIALGRWPQPEQAPVEHPSYRPSSVEDKINDLAKVLGMPSKDLASAIAVAVRNYAPPASLSSAAAKETGPVVQALLQEFPVNGRDPASPGMTGIVGQLTEGVRNFVGAL